MFEEVTNRRRDLVEIFTFERISILLLLADGVLSVFRREAYGWLVLSVLVLASMLWLVRHRMPEREEAARSFVLLATGLAMVLYGVFAILHHDKFGWAYVITGVAGPFYALARRLKSEGHANC